MNDELVVKLMPWVHYFLFCRIQLVNQSIVMHLIKSLSGKVLDEQGRLFCQPKVEAD